MDDVRVCMSRWGDGSGASSNDPNRGMGRCSSMVSSGEDSIPNSMESGSIPMKVPRTNRR